MKKEFILYLEEMQPTQPYVDSELIHHRDKKNIENQSSIEVKIIDGELVLIKGHEKVYLAMLKNQKQIEVCWSQDIDDVSYYKHCVEYCQSKGIHTVWDLDKHCYDSDVCRELRLDMNEKYEMKK